MSEAPCRGKFYLSFSRAHGQSLSEGLLGRTLAALQHFTERMAPERKRQYPEAANDPVFVPYVPRADDVNAPEAQFHPRVGEINPGIPF